ncbi:MAG: glycoside hydrolase [Pirellulaceae bacterium]|nr:glycoside hydrolase [Pirellulaceae bacterium]
MKPTFTLLTVLLLAPVAASAAADLPFPAGIEHVRVERSDSDKYQFLHDPAMESHRGELFAAWYNCPQQEIVGESLIRCRRSKDGGKTWGELEVIASDTSGDGIHYVPAQLLSHGGVLHAFVGTMQGGHDRIKSCAVYVLDEATSRWQPRGDIADLFLPNCQPIKMADGNWIMAGRSASRFGVKPFIPAVAISQGDDLTGRWNVVPLQTEMTSAHCPETTVWVEGSQVVALTRNNTGAAPFVYSSQDYGRTWNAVKEHTLTASASKLYAGHLSSGERYVVFNLPAQGESGFRSRETLVIGVSRPGELAPARIWRVQDRTAPDSPTAFHYPCAVEHEGRLLVLYTIGRTTPRQCELAIIPIASLQLKNR